MEGITYYESPVFELKRFIKNKGYMIGDDSGKKDCNSIDDRAVSIFKERPWQEQPHSKMGWWEKFTTPELPKDYHIANLWIKDANNIWKTGAIINKKWKFHIFGKQFLEEMRCFANDIFSEFKIPIEIELVQENLRTEYKKGRFGSD